MSDELRAVFLSYASQDAGAAKKICDALRAAGVEVWFDQSELRGGDAWDAKIRKQIKECALFLPVISANTQARAEGYFRLEWHLAEQRSHLIARGRPFIVPVCVDDTADSEALVPDAFLVVQWMRVPGGETSPEFCARVKTLLTGGETVARSRPATRETGATPLVHRRPVWPWVLVAVVALPILYLIFRPRRSPEEIAKILASVQVMAAQAAKATEPAATPPAPPVSPPAPLSEARQLAVRARAMSLDKYNSTADDYAAAEGLIKRALELDANDGEIWAVSSLFNTMIRTRGYDYAPARRELARSQAERALTLAPDSVEGRYALARWQRDNDPDSAVAERTFQEVLARAPDHAGALQALATLYHRIGRFDDAIALFERAARQPDQFALARYGEFLTYFGRSRFADAERCVRESWAASPSSNSVAGLGMVLLTARGDAAGAVQALAAAPAVNRNEHRVVWMSAFAQLAARQPDAALKTLDRLSADFILDNWFTGPKAYWVGRAYAQAGRPEAARLAFESGLAIATAELKDLPGNSELRVVHAELLAWLGRTDEALREERTIAELERPGRDIWIASRARIFAALGRADDALPLLASLVPPKPGVDYGWPLTAALLRIDPLWDKIREDPRFQALVKAPAAPP
jgi:tetratricopeptide (TPR) repeat protein